MIPAFEQNHTGALINAACIVELAINGHHKQFVAEMAVEACEQLTLEIFTERTKLVPHKREK